MSKKRWRLSNGIGAAHSPALGSANQTVSVGAGASDTDSTRADHDAHCVVFTQAQDDIAYANAHYAAALRAAHSGRITGPLSMGAVGLVGNGVMMQAPFSPEPPAMPEPLERTVSIGEFIGWRVWRVRVDDRLLESYSAGRIWLPGEPMKGKPSDHGPEGVWAFRDRERAVKKMNETILYIMKNAFIGRPGLAALGSVWLWGDVIEHEIGYRAEFAEVRSLEVVGGVEPHAAMLAALQARYGVEADTDPSAWEWSSAGIERGSPP